MNEIPELKEDFAFLKKIDARNSKWKDFDRKKPRKEKVRTNFLLHPKRLLSDSECSLLSSPHKLCDEKESTDSIEKDNDVSVFSRGAPQEPHKLYDAKQTSTAIVAESNNNFNKELCRRLDNVKNDDIFFETWMEDPEVTITHIKSANVKKTNKVGRPSSTRFENFDRKFTNLLERSLKIVNSIKEMMEKGIPPPDGEEDFSRRLKRLQEFSSRFSRNYLYPLVRHTEELSVGDKLGAGIINQKILYSQQVILRGLQAYYNHLPSSIGKCCSDKLKSLLEQALYLCQLYESLKKDGDKDNNEFIKVTRTQTELLLDTINSFDLKVLEKSRKSSPKNKSKPPVKKNMSKLAMYSVSASFRRDLEWRRAIEALAKKKFNVKSRYKTATFKHRPPVEKPRLVELPSKMKLFPKRSSGALAKTPMKSPIREDDIKTLVEMEGDLEAPPNSSVVVNHENSVASSVVQLGDEPNEGSVEKALQVLRKFLGEGDVLDKVEKIVTEVGRKMGGTEKVQNEKKKFKEPTITVTGAKNAKLICIRDDNSIAEVEDDKNDKDATTELKLKCSETQTDLSQEIKNRINKSRSAIKISRLPKSDKKLLKPLAKNYAINIIQYKLRYSHFHKQNPMYRKSANIQPWILMGRISDDILDHILQSVSSELEVNEILENLYNAEFQY